DLSTEQALGFGAGTVFLFFYDTRGGMVRVGIGGTIGVVSAPSRPFPAPSSPAPDNTRARRPGDNANRVACINPGHPALP
ncbi:MAG: hypothetical protein KDE56_19840, partial [Anaerolineales bacterium]|nr:hypothetical protein [Anaerolineales bacterium]